MKHLKIENLKEYNSDILSALNNLLPQLTERKIILKEDELREMINAPHTNIYIIRNENDADKIIGSLTMTVFRIPTGKAAHIDDVVVDSRFRGLGAGEKLMRRAVSDAEKSGVSKISLTSHPRRKAANRLYQRLQFNLHETNSYCLNLEKFQK